MPSPNSSTPHISETTLIPINEPLARAGAIAYLAILAYPSRAEWRHRDNFVKAAKAWLFWRAVKRGYPKNLIKAEFVDKWRKKFGRTKADAAIDRAYNRIASRQLPAAAMFRWIKFHGFQIKLQFNSSKGVRFKNLPLKLGYKGIPDQEGKRLSVNKAAEHYGGIDEIVNVKHRVWAESLPVLHLAMALENEIRRFKDHPPDNLKRHPLDYLILDPSWLPKALKQAEMIRLFTMPYLASHGHQAI